MERKVELGDCRCPGVPHRVDWVEVIEQTSLPLGAAFIAAARNGGGNPVVVEAQMADAGFRYGIARWSFVDETGDPIPVDYDEGTRLMSFEERYRIADRVVDLHYEAVFRPLISRTSTLSPGGQTDGSTSATPPTGKKPPRPLRPSSPTSTDGPQSEATAAP